MKLIVHKMFNCARCWKCTQLLEHWNIAFKVVYDKPQQNRLYPYITIELEYEELVDWVAKEKINQSD